MKRKRRKIKYVVNAIAGENKRGVFLHRELSGGDDELLMPNNGGKVSGEELPTVPTKELYPSL